MTAHVSDFGLARFIGETMNWSHPNQSSSVGLKGTVGCAAPEYGMGGKVSTYGDVYSHGILLLEMFTGKRPTDDMFKDRLDLHNFVKSALPEQPSEVLDPSLGIGGALEENEIIYGKSHIKMEQIQESLIAILGIGIACKIIQRARRY